MRDLSCALFVCLLAAPVSAQPRTFDEELPDEASAGPRFDPARASRATPPPGLARPDFSDPDHPVSLSLHFGVGYAMPSSIDGALATHFYGAGDGGVMVTGDFQLTYRTLDWLWLGGRFGFRGRGWGRDGDAGAQGGGFDVLGVIHARGQFGRVFELGAMLGVGAGVAGILINHAINVGPAPRLTGALEVAFRLSAGVRLQIRASWDYFPWNDLDRFGNDLDLGGPSVALGLEVRS